MRFTRLEPALAEQITECRGYIGLRNILNHRYPEIHHPTMWNTIATEIPLLIQEVEATHGSSMTDQPWRQRYPIGDIADIIGGGTPSTKITRQTSTAVHPLARRRQRPLRPARPSTSRAAHATWSRNRDKVPSRSLRQTAPARRRPATPRCAPTIGYVAIAQGTARELPRTQPGLPQSDHARKGDSSAEYMYYLATTSLTPKTTSSTICTRLAEHQHLPRTLRLNQAQAISHR